MPVIPLAIMAGSAIISHYAAKSAAAAAAKRSAEEKKALAGGQAGAGTLTEAGTQSIATGEATQKPATNYYDTLLHGNRAQMAQATSGAAANISDVYGGATRNLEQSGQQGAQKDVAAADLNKNRASALSSLVTGVQPAAASALTSIGQTQKAQGAGMVGSANSTYANLLGQGQANRLQANEEGNKTAAAIGAIGTSVANVYAGGATKAPVSTGDWGGEVG